MSIAEQQPPVANGQIQVLEKRPLQVRVVEDESPIAYLMDTARFEHTQRIASLMARASLTPAHLTKGGPDAAMGNCFLVTGQAIRWGFDPFLVAQHTYVVQGKLGYEGKLIAAVVNARAGLKSSLRYEFVGQGDDLTITVIGTFRNEDEPRIVTLSVRQAKTANDMWIRDPEQKLAYSGAIRWARRHCPEITLGVVTDDDLERIAEQKPRPAAGGATTLDALTTQLTSAQETEVVTDDQGEVQEPFSDEPTVDEGYRIRVKEVLDELHGIADVEIAAEEIAAKAKSPEEVAIVRELEKAAIERIRNARGPRSNPKS